MVCSSGSVIETPSRGNGEKRQTHWYHLFSLKYNASGSGASTDVGVEAK